jgi:membrane protease YdiL (CAAX protease family)
MENEQQPQSPESPPLGDTVASLDLRSADESPWTAWDVLLIAIMFVFSDFVATACAAVYFLRVHHESLEELASDTRIIIPAQLVAYAITFLLMYLIITQGHHRPFWRGMRWLWPPGGVAVVGLVVTGVPLALGISYLETVLPMPTHVPFERLFTSVNAAYVMGVLAVVIAPFMEELFFRGFLYPVLRRLGPGLAVVLTALAFAGVHGAQYGWAWAAVLLMFIVGLVLTMARALTGSVAPGFLIHVGYNLTLFVLLYFSTDHFRHLERISQ